METKNLDVRLDACIILQKESEQALKALCSKVKTCKKKEELENLLLHRIQSSWNYLKRNN